MTEDQSQDCVHGFRQSECATCFGTSEVVTAPARQISVADAEKIRKAVNVELSQNRKVSPDQVLSTLEGRLRMLLAPDPRGFGIRKVDELTASWRARKIHCEPAELLIMRAVQRTRPAGQFSVTRRGDVFTSSSFGYTQSEDRLYVSGLSPLIYDLGLMYWVHRERAGGRFMLAPNGDVSEAMEPHAYLLTIVPR